MSNAANLNVQVLESLSRLAETLAQLDERGDGSSSVDELTKFAASLNMTDSTTTARPSTQSPSSTPNTNLSHYRTLPSTVTTAYTLLTDGSNYIHATSTKYTLVSKIDYIKEGGNLALELQKGIELIATATLGVFDRGSGCSCSLKKYVKQYARAVVASVISLITCFEDGSALDTSNGTVNNIGAQKTGAVWSACDCITRQLPKGNRNAMRRELMVWVRDCLESIEEFEELMEIGTRDDDGEEEGEDAMEEEEQYTEREMKVAKSSVNVMKCSKNVLGLVLKVFECVGECAEKPADEQSTEQSTTLSDEQRKEMIRWIGHLHELARAVGEGVTEVGVLLYPPLDFTSQSNEAGRVQSSSSSNSTQSIPDLGSSNLGQQLQIQLHALSDCVECIHVASLQSGASVRYCMTDEVVEAIDKLKKAVGVRCAEVKGSMQ
eukprot:scaffold15445_cov221-Alexandrium_tamarense.AAC.6